MVPFIVKHLTLPLHERLKGHSTFKLLAELEKTQWRAAEEIRALQLEKLRALIDHAYTNVPYYRKFMMKAGIAPQDIRELSDLRLLPVLSKEDIRRNLGSLIARNMTNALIRFNTGGSSGSPLVFYVDKRRMSCDVAARLRARRWWGIDVGDKELALWGAPTEVAKQGWLRDLRDLLVNSRFLSAFNMNEKTMLEFARIAIKYRPRHIFGYPSSIYLFCLFLNKMGIDLRRAGIKVAFVTGELLYDYQRQLIESTLGCRVANGYGGRDCGFVAHECPEGGMHITAENVIVEVLQSSEEGRGEIAITHLDMYGMPFIRYRTGDIGLLSGDVACRCGRGLPLMKVVEGRSTDFIVTSEGRIMHGLSLIYILRDLPGIAEFKIVQRAEDKLDIYIVRGARYDRALEEHIRRAVAEKMGTELEVNFRYLDAIEPEAAGKYRYVVSEVAPKYLQRYI